MAAARTDHSVTIDGETITTPRLVLRPWSVADAPEALRVFGDESVTRWLSPAMAQVPTVESMESVISAWLDAPFFTQAALVLQSCASRRALPLLSLRSQW